MLPASLPSHDRTLCDLTTVFFALSPAVKRQNQKDGQQGDEKVIEIGNHSCKTQKPQRHDERGSKTADTRYDRSPESRPKALLSG
jgi:hypothetical protein